MGSARRHHLLLGGLVAILGSAVACGRTGLLDLEGRCLPTDPTCQIGVGGSGGGASPDGGLRPDAGWPDGPASDRPVCGSAEICGNGRDDDCNALIDCADPGCYGDRACSRPGQEVCNNALDDDDDLLIDCADPDCRGSLACRPSMGRETCDNGIDDNADRLIDCADPQCTTFPGCLTVDCTADVDFGALAAHGARASRDLDTRGATRSFVTCAPAGGHGRVGSFTLAAPADVRLDFSQRAGGAHVVALFRAGASQACDRNLVECVAAGQVPSTTHTFPALAAGTYFVVVESYPGTEGATTVVLSTGALPTPEICANGIDDDGNGLTDCQDLACRTAPSCSADVCMPDANVGALVIGDAPKTANADLAVAPSRYRPTCAGNVPGGDTAISLTLPEAGGVLVQYRQSGHTIFSLFRAPGPGQACDASQIGCAFEEQPQNAIAFSGLPAGRYILILKAISNAEAGTLNLRISAFGNRDIEVCGNQIDDDANGLTDCDDPACFGVGSCGATACAPDVDLGSLSPGAARATVLDTRGAPDLYTTTCGRGNGRERVVRVTLTQPMALGIDCMQTGSHVLELAQQLEPLDACNANEVGCADPQVLPFGCGYSIPGLQPGRYNVIVEAFQAGSEGTVTLTLSGVPETVREICDNGIDDDSDGAIDCADRKCVTSPACQQFACRADSALGLLPLDGSPSAVVVQTTMSGNDQTLTACASAPGGEDGVLDFQLPAPADLTFEWAQVGTHDFALYADDGPLLSCEAGRSFGCIVSAGRATGTVVLPDLPGGRYHLVVDADRPGAEGGVVLQLSAVAAVP